MLEPQSANMTINTAVTLTTKIITIPFNENPPPARAEAGGGENPGDGCGAWLQKLLTKTPPGTFDFPLDADWRCAGVRSFRNNRLLRVAATSSPRTNHEKFETNFVATFKRLN
jgi:hypothetical protein